MADDLHGSNESLDDIEVNFNQATLNGYVGFDTITEQWKKKQLKKGFEFNIMVVGQTGLGKSTFVNTLFSSHVLDSKGPQKASDQPRSTTEVEVQSHLIEEGGVKLFLQVVDTPGFGENVNNEKCYDPIVKHIQYQYQVYHKQESAIQRKKNFRDSRIHACLYFITPSGHGLKPIDIEAMKNLCEFVNLVPVIAKSDSLTPEEQISFKKRINEELKYHKIKVYPRDYSDYDKEEMMLNEQVSRMIPFSVVGSEKTVAVGGKAVRGRKMRWGVINIEDETHCEFSQLRNFLMRTHLQDLISTTHYVHYEGFRHLQLTNKMPVQKKEKKKESKSAASKARI